MCIAVKNEPWIGGGGVGNVCIAMKKGPWIAIVTSEMSKATSKSVQFCKSCGSQDLASKDHTKAARESVQCRKKW